MKKVLWLIVCLMTMAVFTSCSKGEEGETTQDYKSLIVGTWEVTHVEGVVDLSTTIPELQNVKINKSFISEESSPNPINDAINDFHQRFQFSNINNSVTIYSYRLRQWDTNFPDRLLYYIKGNKLTIYDTDKWLESDEHIENTYDILFLAENSMILHLSGENSKRAREHGKTNQYITLELKRVAF